MLQAKVRVWKVDGEVEKVLWNHLRPEQLLVRRSPLSLSLSLPLSPSLSPSLSPLSPSLSLSLRAASGEERMHTG